jgi:DNA-directed RNA polymerase specialized sigma24 family protein
MIMAEPAERTDLEPAAPTPEMDLVSRSQHGDLAAYDELVQRYQERIYATVYHMTSNHEDANDLAQDSFIKAFQALNLSRAAPVSTHGFTGLRSTRRSIF